MSISSIGAQSALIMKALVQMRAQFDDLQRQLATGHKSATYAGLGIDRGVTVSLNSQLSAISSYDDSERHGAHQPDEHRARQHDQYLEPG
jgi:flagellar hook-associated protein 3 FlgL